MIERLARALAGFEPNSPRFFWTRPFSICPWVLIFLSLCLSWDRSRAENLAPGDELQITRLYILRWHFEQQVREFLVADSVLHEKVYCTNP